jgi:hypothetical protein
VGGTGAVWSKSILHTIQPLEVKTEEPPMSSLAQPCFDIPNLDASVFHHVHSSHVCYEVPTLSNVSCQNTSTLILKLTVTVRVV